MMAEKGFTNAEVSHTVTPVAGGPKLVNVTFNINEGPKIKIRNIEFIGNTAKSDGTLRRKMKDNKPPNPFWGWITRRRHLQGSQVRGGRRSRSSRYYRNEGYVRAQVGQPEIEGRSRTPSDGKTRWIQLRIPVTEGQRLPRRRSFASTATPSSRARRCAAVQGRKRRLVQREGDSRRPRSRRGRSTAPAATWSSPGFPSSS